MKQKIEQINSEMALEYGLVEGEEVSYSQVRDAIRNPENFAKRIETSEVEISEGVKLSDRSVELGGGDFTNIYDLNFDSSDPTLNVQIITRKHPLYAHRLFVNEQNNPSDIDRPVACINGSFFFLQDEKLVETPTEIIYNLNIRDGKVLGLPAVDRPALLVNKEGRIQASELKASGTIRIGSKEVSWVGGEPIVHRKVGQEKKVYSGQTVLFNSACCTIQYENQKDKTSLRKLRQDLNHTPIGNDVVDIVVNADEQGNLSVSSVKHGGGSDFFEGNFILQMKSNEAKDIEVGDVVDPKTVSDFDLHEVNSAMTTGPSVASFQSHSDHEINNDPSLGTFPPFASNARYARSVMYEDRNGRIHMVVFDAVPRSEHMKGVTPYEAAKNIPEDAKWSVFLDGGQSSRVTFESIDPNTGSSKIDARGNKQYVRLHKLDKKSQMAGVDDRFLWTTRGRPLSSMIALYRRK